MYENLPSNCPQNFSNDCTPGFYITSQAINLDIPLIKGSLFMSLGVMVNIYWTGNKSFRIRYIKNFIAQQCRVTFEAVTVGIIFIDGDIFLLITIKIFCL